MKIVPGVKGKYGLSICATKFDGLITGSYGAPPSRSHAARRASFCALQFWRASLRSSNACSRHASRAAESARLSHFARASQQSLWAARRQDFKTVLAVSPQVLIGSATARQFRNVNASTITPAVNLADGNNRANFSCQEWSLIQAFSNRERFFINLFLHQWRTGFPRCDADYRLTSLDVMSMVIMKPLVPLNSKAFSPTLYASTSLGIRMKPSFRGAASYFKFLMTIGSAVIPSIRLSANSAILPPSKRASVRSWPDRHTIVPSLPTMNEFHFTG